MYKAHAPNRTWIVFSMTKVKYCRIDDELWAAFKDIKILTNLTENIIIVYVIQIHHALSIIEIR